jgi:PPK2 family polyphosphate:nucleotide phosphotransferase
MDTKKFLVSTKAKINLSKFPTDYSGKFKSKKEAVKLLKKNVERMTELQAKLYAQDKYSLLVIFQAMDAAGKDGTIKHVMSGLNPQGTQVSSFKQPSKEELDHGYLWRINKALPERGRIGIFNRSHYEEVLIVRVHNLIRYQKIPDKFNNKSLWKQRYKQINSFEEYLYENGIVTIKFFLHVSKEEQKKRFLERIEDTSKNWKFSSGDIEERKHWDEYQKAYQDAISATSKKHSPWFVIPADKKWFARLAVSEIIVQEMKKLKPEYPKLNEGQLQDLEKSKQSLLNE